MKKNSLKTVAAALAAVMVIAVGAIGILKTSAGFKFTAKSDDVVVTAADFSGVIRVGAAGNAENKWYTFDERDKNKPIKIRFKPKTSEFLFDSKDITQKYPFMIKNKGNCDIELDFKLEVLPEDSSKSNDVALSKKINARIIKSESNEIVSNLQIPKEKDNTVNFNLLIDPIVTNGDESLAGLDNDAINGNVIVKVTIDIVPVR